MMFHVKRVPSDNPAFRAYEVVVSRTQGPANGLDETSVLVDCICYWCSTAVLDFQQLGNGIRRTDRARDYFADDSQPELEL